MKKVALVFALAVFVPSLVLAWLAVRSLRDQEFVLQRQQSLLYQAVTDTLARQAENLLTDHQRQFGLQVEQMLANNSASEVARSFDEKLRANWPLAEVGFAVTANGDIIAPAAAALSLEAKSFRAENSEWIANRGIAEVYLSAKNEMNAPVAMTESLDADRKPESRNKEAALTKAQSVSGSLNYKSKTQQLRSVAPQQKSDIFSLKDSREPAPQIQQPVSRITPAEAEFRDLVGEANEGTVARFVDNKLKILFWHRSPQDSRYIFGAQLALPKLNAELDEVTQQLEPALREEICVAVLDDNAKPVSLSQKNFKANWKHPFVATEIGEELPHWEVAAYLLNPGKLTQSAQTLKLTLGLLIGVLVLVIGIGSWLIVRDLNRQLTLARQKTDFVSNVSHELKTPLTSIRMFSELLAEQRVNDPAKQRSYLNIITAETARLTRLINNVLDFSRMEGGEKKYNFRDCDLVSLVRDTAESYRPHLENNGFKLECNLPSSVLPVRADTDAIAQVIVNLLSNAEKYSDSRREIEIQVSQRDGPLPCAEVKVLDRGLGVPRGSEEKIFEKFYRAHDSLSSGIQGSGLGLTLARQIARAHGGDVAYEFRAGGGSCFCLRLPLYKTTDEHRS
jgi:signal transduction histidine kinase